MNDDDGVREDQSGYRVVDHWPTGGLTSVRLHPDGWTGPDLYILVFSGTAQDDPVGSLQMVSPQQRQRWRDAGLLS